MSKTEILGRTAASIALCAAAAAISYLPGDGLGANNTCISGLVIVIGLAIIWNALVQVEKIITILWD